MVDWHLTFIRLWESGSTTAEMAAALGIPEGTVRSRAYTLQQRGLIQSRPRGGRRTPARKETPPATPAPTASPAEQVAPALPAMTFVAVPEIQEILSIVKDLQARVVSLEDTRVTPALPAPPATPTAPAVERRDVMQWTVRLSQSLIDELKRLAYEERLNPSELVERLLRKALTC